MSENAGDTSDTIVIPAIGNGWKHKNYDTFLTVTGGEGNTDAAEDRELAWAWVDEANPYAGEWRG